MNRAGVFLFCASAIVTTALLGCSGGEGLSSSGAKSLGKEDPQGRYSVLLHIFTDPDMHMPQAQQYKVGLEQQYGWTGLRIVSQQERSELYWGRFRVPTDARNTLQQAKSQGFAQAVVVALPGSTEGPPEWDFAKVLERAPYNIMHEPAAYSLLVAVFENEPLSSPPYVECAKDAVEYCQELRRQGYEAYYHHGPNKSSVTIGLFGPDAIRLERRQVHQFEQEKPVIINNMVIQDQRLLDLQRRFPKLAYNGRELIQTSRNAQGHITRRTVAETYVVKAPGSK